jgi:glycosyltransferase involved in cell wall biosynthesis
MLVGWLADRPEFVGGAELTQAEFRAAAPAGVEVVDCPPGEVVPDLDRYVVHNCGSYSVEDLRSIHAPIIRYVHDAWNYGDPQLRFRLLASARVIFTSPLHRHRFPFPFPTTDVDVIPPAIPLSNFRNGDVGDGCVCIGRMAYGKGVERLVEYDEPVDVYSPVPLESRGSLTYRGALDPADVPATLVRYGRFVFLPSVLEPFGRGVVEAWASGLEYVVNRNVGARHWIEEEPEKLTTASKDFWERVCA